MDCLKAVGAFLVVMIHCHNPWKEPDYVWTFAVVRMAIPIFFMISGFFLWSPDRGVALRNCRRAFVRIFWLTVFANLFYYLCFFVPMDVMPFKRWKQVVKFLIFGHYGGTIEFHLWYLNAYLETLLVMMAALKLRCLRAAWWLLIPAGLLVGLIMGKYEFLVPWIGRQQFSDWEPYCRNFFTLGIPCVGMGWLVRQHADRLLAIVKRPAVWLVALLAVSELEVFGLHTFRTNVFGEYVISTIPLAVVMMLIAVKYPDLGASTLLAWTGRRFSLGIYVFHILFLRLIVDVDVRFIIDRPMLLPMATYGLALAFTALWGAATQGRMGIKN